MTTDDRLYTFVIAHTSYVRSISLHKRSLLIAASLAASVALAVLCTALYGLYSVPQRTARLHLERENELLRREAQTHQQQLNNLVDRIEVIEDTSRRLAETSGLVIVPPATEARGAGGPALPVDVSSLRKIENRARQIERELHERSRVPSIWPVQGWTTDRFGVRRNPFAETLFEFHAGQDIAAAWGTPVATAGSGTVTFADAQAGYGRLVIVDHGDGLSTRYGHLSSIDVVPNQAVVRGQTVGRVGSTGRSTGPHLHYEVRIGEEAVNPRRYLPSRTN